MTDTKSGAPKSTTPAPQETKLSESKIFDEKIVTQVIEYLNRKQEEGLTFPPDYSFKNAVVLAKLHLLELRDKDGKLVVDQCTPASVVKALVKMSINGFNVNKKQCAFIKYGAELICQPEYFGNLMIAKRDADIKEVNGRCVYQGDELVYNVDISTGRTQIVKFEPKLENQDITKIKGAFAIVLYNDGTTKAEIMTMAQIKASWDMGAMKGGSPAHKNFTDQMVLKSVKNRAVKEDINTSDDSEILTDFEQDHLINSREKILTEKSNKKAINTTDVEFEDINTPPVRTKEQEIVQHPVPPEEAALKEELFQVEAKPEY